MKPILTLALALGTITLLSAQDEGKRKVEMPLKKSVAPSAPEKYDLARTGIEWHRGLEAVLNQGRPILLLQILGNYDDVYC